MYREKVCSNQLLSMPCCLLTSSLHSRFFETEGIAILTMLVSRYKIEIKEEPQFVGESLEARHERILAAKPGVTLT
jgi:hypothetical protein